MSSQVVSTAEGQSQGSGKVVFSEHVQSSSGWMGCWSRTHVLELMTGLLAIGEVGLLVWLIRRHRKYKQEMERLNDQVLFHQAVVDSWTKEEDDYEHGLQKQRSYYYHANSKL